ncbi:MAG: SOS response-associated peptidase [Candidatus Altiarchaeota archaeon]
MCGRFSLFHNSEEIRRRFRLKRLFREWMKRYNIAPTQRILIIREEDGERTADEATWGLVPAWAKDGAKGVINARAESYQMKPTFREAQRCLIVADGFYEWQKQGSIKQPYRITLSDGGLFAFAGLYDYRFDDRTAVIITTGSNEMMKVIHDRMPAILDAAHEDLWIDPRSDANTLSNLLKPYPGQRMNAVQISQRINDAENEGPDLIEAAMQRQTTL